MLIRCDIQIGCWRVQLSSPVKHAWLSWCVLPRIGASFTCFIRDFQCYSAIFFHRANINRPDMLSAHPLFPLILAIFIKYGLTIFGISTLMEFWLELSFVKPFKLGLVLLSSILLTRLCNGSLTIHSMKQLLQLLLTSWCCLYSIFFPLFRSVSLSFALFFISFPFHFLSFFFSICFTQYLTTFSQFLTFSRSIAVISPVLFPNNHLFSRFNTPRSSILS